MEYLMHCTCEAAYQRIHYCGENHKQLRQVRAERRWSNAERSLLVPPWHNCRFLSTGVAVTLDQNVGQTVFNNKRLLPPQAAFFLIFNFNPFFGGGEKGGHILGEINWVVLL